MSSEFEARWRSATQVSESTTGSIANPTNFKVEAGDGKATLTWTPSATPEAVGTGIYQDGVLVHTAAAGVNSHVITGLTNGKQYSFSLDTVVKMTPLTPISVTPKAPVDTIVLPPQNFQVVAGDKEVTLSWDFSTTEGVTAYGLYQDGVYLFNRSVPNKGFTVTGLTNGRQYTFTIDAFKNNFRSAKVANKTATPKAPIANPTNTGGGVVVDSQAYSVKAKNHGTWLLSNFTGEKLKQAKVFDNHLKLADPEYDNIRQAPKNWSFSGSYPDEGTRPTGLENDAFGANPIQRGALNRYANVVYYSLMASKDPRFVDRAYLNLDRAMGLLQNRGAVNDRTKNDGWLGWRYGTKADGNFPTNDAGDEWAVAIGAYSPLEAALVGGAGGYARILWENRDTITAGGFTAAQKILLVNKFRAWYWLHHVPRFLKWSGIPSVSDPSRTGRNFAHSDMAEAQCEVHLAKIETDMYKLNMRSAVTVDLADGFTNQVIGLQTGTTADIKTHPGWALAKRIYLRFKNGQVKKDAAGNVIARTMNIVKGTDIRDETLRAAYGDLGCAFWAQDTDSIRFAANSGYNQATYSGIVILFLEGVCADAVGNDEAIKFMQQMAAGCSAGMLPQRLVGKFVSSYVVDDATAYNYSAAFKKNGTDDRWIPSRASGETDSTGEWVNEMYGLLSMFDPINRIAPITQSYHDKVDNSARTIGGPASIMINLIAREQNPEWSKIKA